MMTQKLAKGLKEALEHVKVSRGRSDRSAALENLAFAVLRMSVGRRGPGRRLGSASALTAAPLHFGVSGDAHHRRPGASMWLPQLG